MADGVYVFLRSRQLSLNNFFDPNTPSIRKGHKGGEKNGEKEKNADRLCQLQNLTKLIKSMKKSILTPPLFTSLPL